MHRSTVLYLLMRLCSSATWPLLDVGRTRWEGREDSEQRGKKEDRGDKAKTPLALGDLLLLALLLLLTRVRKLETMRGVEQRFR